MITILYTRNTLDPVVMQLCTRKCSNSVFWLHTSAHTQARSASLHVQFWQLYGRMKSAMRGCSAAVWNICVVVYFSNTLLFAIPWSCKPCLKCRGLEKLWIDQKSSLFHSVESYQDALKSCMLINCD